MAALQIALEHNPKNMEVLRKIKRLTQVSIEQSRTLELESMRSNISMSKYLDPLKVELVSESRSSAFLFPYPIQWRVISS